jgi:hypothetical protein
MPLDLQWRFYPCAQYSRFLYSSYSVEAGPNQGSREVLESETSFPFIHCWGIIDLEDGRINLSFPCDLGTSARDRDHSAIFGPLTALDEINGISTELSVTLLKLVVDAPHVTWDVLANMTEMASKDLRSLSGLKSTITLSTSRILCIAWNSVSRTEVRSGPIA